MTLWSKRKAAVAAEAEAEAKARTEAARQAEDRALAERSDEELLAEAGVKAPEDLVDAAEIRDFLRHALPERLKRRALRRLWGTNPVLACLDGLNDYDDDYTDAAGGGPVQTAYVVGKGMAAQFKAFVEPEKVEEASDAVTSEVGTTQSRTCSGTSTPEDCDEVPPDQVRDRQEQVRDAEHQVAETAPEPEADPPATTRRMRFTFEEAR
ncbi:MAG: DUF3306 domain-containing protein [Rhodobacteraceae bacterium]|nr:MAG: DUF3306 domain-containing protein [Paracoccaceae bacterium]